VLITGGTGYLGRALVKKLLGDGCPRICIYSRNEYAQAKMRAELNDDRGCAGSSATFGIVQRLERAMRSVYSVIHAAALKRIEVGAYDPDEMVKTNVYGTMNVIEAARRVEIGKVVLVSSDKAYAAGFSLRPVEGDGREPDPEFERPAVRPALLGGAVRERRRVYRERDPDVARGVGEREIASGSPIRTARASGWTSGRPRSSWSTRSFR
jgi:nucleoside-diphosphate-sugar epimerase